VTKTLIDVDEELLASARTLLGTATTKKDAVNRALGELLRLSTLRAFLHATGLHERESPGLVLVDASVMAECGSPSVVARLLPLLVLDAVTTCAAVRHELAGLPDDPTLDVLRRVELRWLPTDDEDLTRASEIQAQLSEQGERQLPWSRLVVAAVAERHEARVLHYSVDYELIAKVTGQPMELMALPGTLPESS